MGDDAHEPQSSSPASGDLAEAARRRGAFGQTLKAVAWSFFGVRKSSEYDKDVQRINPVHVLVAGVVLAVVFVLSLIFLVQWVVGSGVAAH